MHTEKMLTDNHVHLDQYSPGEMENVIINADQAGVQWCVTLGMDLKSSMRAVEIAIANKKVLAGVGIHPWFSAEYSNMDITTLLPLAQEKVAVVIGEIGLDFEDNIFTGVKYHNNVHLQNIQIQVFRTQIELANQLNLPVNVHCRGAYPTLISILKNESAYGVRGVLHNYGSDEIIARTLLDLGFYISFGGTVTYPNAVDLRKLARVIPLDGFLLETDSPYMPIYEQIEEKNEPANVAFVARTFAEVKGIEIEKVIEASYENFINLIRIDKLKDL